MKARNPYTIVAVIALLLAALACGPVATVIVTATPPPQEVEEASPTPTTPPSATSPPATAVPAVTAESGCTLNAGWVADVTVPDNTEFAPGTPFVKTWRVRNSGSCTWEAGTQLIYVSGDPLGGPAAVSVPQVAPGATTDVSVNFVAPSTPGTYRSTWQMQSPAGTRFGSQIYVQIVVPAPATATPIPPTAAPTAVPTAVPTVAPTDTPTPPDLTVTAVEFAPPSPNAGSSFQVRITIHNPGGVGVPDFVVRALRQARGAACPTGPGTVLFDRHTNVAAGGTIVFTENATIADAGDYSICAILDHVKAVAEINEGNNSLQRDITVSSPGQPDLYPFFIGLNTWNPRVDQDVSASITLRNGGNSPVSNFTVRLLRQSPGASCPGPGTVIFDTTASLEANGSMVFRQTFRFSAAGTYQLCVVLDHMNRVGESNEGNNAIKSDQNVVVSP